MTRDSDDDPELTAAQLSRCVDLIRTIDDAERLAQMRGNLQISFDPGALWTAEWIHERDGVSIAEAHGRGAGLIECLNQLLADLPAEYRPGET